MPGKHCNAWSPHGQRGDGPGQVGPQLLDLELPAHKTSHLFHSYYGLGSVWDAFGH